MTSASVFILWALRDRITILSAATHFLNGGMDWLKMDQSQRSFLFEVLDTPWKRIAAALFSLHARNTALHNKLLIIIVWGKISQEIMKWQQPKVRKKWDRPKLTWMDGIQNML